MQWWLTGSDGFKMRLNKCEDEAADRAISNYVLSVLMQHWNIVGGGEERPAWED